MKYKELICAALNELSAAAENLKKSTVPATPMPRPRFFGIAPRSTWPKIWGNSDEVMWDVLGVMGTYCYLKNYKGASAEICETLGHQPRLILRSLRRIQSATAWCYARAEGRKRQAEEILRQQTNAAETLEAEAAMQSLKE